MSPQPDHKSITEAELKGLAGMVEAGVFAYDHDPNLVGRLIAEVRRLREALTSYAEVSNWWHGQPLGEPSTQGRRHVLWEHPHPDYRNAPGYKLARLALGWGPPAEPCENPSCDGVRGDKTYGDAHRCFKDGRWLDDGSEM